MITASLDVSSLSVTPTEVTSILRLEPDAVVFMGMPSRLAGHSYPRNLWRKSLVIADNLHAGTEGISQALVALGTELAERLAILSGQGASIALDLVQKVVGETDTQSTGILLSVDAMKWLATAHAELSIDQYFSVDPNGPDG